MTRRKKRKKMLNHYNNNRNQRYFVRMTRSERLQHLVLMLCVGTLVLTGFMLEGELWVIESFGSAGKTIFFWRGILHRVAGIGLILLGLYHLYYITFTREGRSWIYDMLPRWKDFVDMVQNVGYLLGLRKERPLFDRFTYQEKLEYFSIYFGVPIVVVSGIMLWFEYKWNKFYLDVAEAFHKGEATLAALAIMVWHIFTVFFKPGNYPLNTTFIHGLMSEEDVRHHHPLWYERLKEEEAMKKEDDEDDEEDEEEGV